MDEKLLLRKQKAYRNWKPSVLQEGQKVRFNTPVNTMTTLKTLDAVICMSEESDPLQQFATLQKGEVVLGIDLHYACTRSHLKPIPFQKRTRKRSVLLQLKQLKMSY